MPNFKKIEEKHIIKLNSCSDKNFISPIVITVKRDKTVKLALDSKILNKSIHKNKYQMPNIDNLIDTIQQNLNTNASQETAYFSALDLSTHTSNLICTRKRPGIATSIFLAVRELVHIALLPVSTD